MCSIGWKLWWYWRPIISIERKFSNGLKWIVLEWKITSTSFVLVSPSSAWHFGTNSAKTIIPIVWMKSNLLWFEGIKPPWEGSLLPGIPTEPNEMKSKSLKTNQYTYTTRKKSEQKNTDKMFLQVWKIEQLWINTHSMLYRYHQSTPAILCAFAEVTLVLWTSPSQCTCENIDSVSVDTWTLRV